MLRDSLRRFTPLFLVGAALSGCAGAPARAPTDPATLDSAARTETSAPIDSSRLETVPLRGRASWYGRRFRGRRTASGERFDPRAFTAAHRTLPFGTRVRVRCPSTGRETVVRVNDRGPKNRDRVIDLSQAAARALGITGLGIVEVTIEPLGANG